MFVTFEEGAQPARAPLSPRMEQQFAAADAKARAECRNLSKLMDEKLPKELRDLVLGFLCLDDRQIPIGPYYHFRKYEPSGRAIETTNLDTQYCPRTGELQTELADGKIRIDHDIYPQQDLLLPQSHIFDPTYMGRAFILEALELYYQSNSFSVCNVEGGLDDLCTAARLKDGSTTDFVPIDHIRDLQIRVKVEHLHAEAIGVDSPPDLRMKEFVEQEHLFRHTVQSLQAFRSRMQMSPPHELNVEIVLMSESGTWCNSRTTPLVRCLLVNVLQTVRNMVYELLYDRGHATIRVTYQDDTLFTFPMNVFEVFFKLTKEDWQLEKSIQQPNHDWSQDFWILPLRSDELSESEKTELGGYCYDAVDDIMAQRWGFEDVLFTNSEARSIMEGPYWPVGLPYNSKAAQAYLEKAGRTGTEQV